MVDDHTVVRQGIFALLRFGSDIEMVGEAANGKEAVEKTRQLHPDVILMDINMPGLLHTVQKAVPQMGFFLQSADRIDIATVRNYLCPGVSPCVRGCSVLAIFWVDRKVQTCHR